MQRHSRVLAALAILWLTNGMETSGWTQETMPKVNQTRNDLETEIRKPINLSYLLFLPKDYSAEDAKRWPLLLFLHGAGERGSNLGLVKVHGPPKIVQDQPEFPFILVSPQCPAGQYWENDTLLALLDHVAAKHQVDSTRVYLTGLSMGGFGTWNLAMAHPERFAAIAPICGGGDVVPIRLSSPVKLGALKSLGVWAFHGAKDMVVPLSESERMIGVLKGIGHEARLTIYPEAGHDSWTETYANPALYDWLLQHQRRAPKRRTSRRRTRPVR
jgi:predicted peptidase